MRKVLNIRLTIAYAFIPITPKKQTSYAINDFCNLSHKSGKFYLSSVKVLTFTEFRNLQRC